MVMFTIAESCPPDWVEIDSACYKGFKNKILTFPKSIDKCKGLGGTLAKIDTLSKTQLITSILSTSNEYWIGLRNRYDQVELEKFVWIVDNSSSTSFQNWGSLGQPDSEHRCAILSHLHLPGQWRWYPRLCDTHYNRICQVKKSILLGK